MKFQSTIIHLFIALSIISSYGCAALRGISVGQQWSENYALAESARANHPGFIDGNARTIGESEYVEGSLGAIGRRNAASEAVVTLPEPKSIHRVVIHSSNLQAFELWVMDSPGGWRRIKEIKSSKEPVIDIRLNQTVYTAGIKIRVQRTSDDGSVRRQNVWSTGYGRVWSGRTRGTAKIAEIELYGFVPKGEGKEALSHPALDEKPLDEFLVF